MIRPNKAWYLLLLSLICCKKPYNPPAITAPGSYLVVEGVINSGSDSTIIKLSKTVNLSSPVITNAVLHAVVAVESDQNISFPLTETTNGNYVSAGLNLDNTHNYRLSIKTSNSEQYSSDFVAVLNAPPIDSVSYGIEGNELNIYSNTHDPTNTVKYYRWDYQETWIFHSTYDSQSVSNGDTVLQRTANQQVYQCWASDTSSNIIIGSSAKLSKDVIVNNPITSIASSSEKLTTKYSILVRQYALTGDAYNFWTNLKTNTEQLGGIFDAQPSQLNGNIHCITNPSEPVIGYISVGNISSQRIFITNQQLPGWVTTPAYPLSVCPLDTEYIVIYLAPHMRLPVYEEDQYYNYDKSIFSGLLLIPVEPVGLPGQPVTGHSGSFPLCVDCTLRGTTKQPGFWK